MPRSKGSFGFTAVAFDADEDGWQDIFVACDSTSSYLLMNNHDGTFREEALLRGVALSSGGRVLGGMGVGIGDYDLDGHIDSGSTHFQNQSTGLYHNNGKGEFDDVTAKRDSAPSGASSAGERDWSISTTMVSRHYRGDGYGVSRTGEVISAKYPALTRASCFAIRETERSCS